MQRLRGGGGAADEEVLEGVVVGLSVEVLRLEDDTVAVEDESLQRGGGGGRSSGDSERAMKSRRRDSGKAKGRGTEPAREGDGGRRRD